MWICIATPPARLLARQKCGRISSTWELNRPLAPSGFPFPVIHFGGARVIDECECRMPDAVHANFATHAHALHAPITSQILLNTITRTHIRTLLWVVGSVGMSKLFVSKYVLFVLLDIGPLFKFQLLVFKTQNWEFIHLNAFIIWLKLQIVRYNLSNISENSWL